MFKSWAVINYFFPYSALMNDDWSAALSEAADGVSAASDALTYETSVAHMFTHIHDSHSFPRGPTLYDALGTQPPPCVAQLVGGQLVVTRIVDSVATQTGVAVGDIIEDIQGEAIAARMARYTQVFPASTQQALNARLESEMVRGNRANIKLSLAKADGSHKTVQVRPDYSYYTYIGDATNGQIYSVLANNIGYVDLTRLTEYQISDMESKLGKTRAIVFDMRGYPHGTAWPLSQWLDKHPNAEYAHFTRRRLAALDLAEGGNISNTLQFASTLLPPQEDNYQGKTYMLIDERALSQAEYTGMILREAANTVFVGSPSNGADGDITFIVLPGGMQSSFTGEGITWPDGSQQQRQGPQPDIAVSPTLAGIRAGKDEVLDAALAAALHDTGG